MPDKTIIVNPELAWTRCNVQDTSTYVKAFVVTWVAGTSSKNATSSHCT